MCKSLPSQDKGKLEQITPQKPQRENTKEPENLQTTLVGPICSGKVVLQTLMVVVVGNGVRRQVRALLDSGSQRSYIKKETAESLGLVPHAEEPLRHVVFGGTAHTKTHRKYMVTVTSIKGGVSRELELIDQERICGTLPRVDKGPWMQALRDRKIQLSDVGEGAPEIEILFGSDCLGSILMSRVLHLQNGMTAVQTRFGWTVMGKTDRQEDVSAGVLTIALTVSEAAVSDLWSLESIGIGDPAESSSRKENENKVLQHFQETVSRGIDGRYSVCLPWTTAMHEPPDNREVALKRLSTTTNKLIAAGCYEAYNGVFQSWLEEGIIEVVPEAEQERPAYYLPHRAVLRPESRTTPVRPVFDASCKTGRSPSLNECLECGPNLIELLPTIILRFRKGRIGVVSDIRRAFLQIGVNPQDRDFLRFLWWSDNSRSDYVIYRHRRVVFGVKSSPFLLGAVICHHLNKLIDNQDTKNLVSTGEKLRRSLYVDNCVASVDSVEELEQFKEEATLILNQAKLDLQDWEQASAQFPELLYTADPTDMLFTAENRSTKVLGLSWNLEKDTLSFVLPTPPVGLMTKRSILSRIAGVYDPVGVLCPVLIEPRLIVQTAWASKCSWDEELSNELKTRYEKWWKETPMLSDIAIPRNMSAGVCNIDNWQLHIFCDASQDAFAAVSFLRATGETGTSVQLVMARARIAPLNKPSMPRLELLARTIGARLGATIRKDLELGDIQTFFWSDSTTALAWIRRNDAWGTFVGNRVKEICGLTNPNDWRHVPGTQNPADLPSRGCSPRRLLESRWWEGPDWLREAQNEWPVEVPEVSEEEILLEKRLTAMKVGLVVAETHWLARRFSSYKKNVRVVAWMFRFLNNTRQQGQRISGDVSADEFRTAEYTVFRLIQRDCFHTGREVIEGLRVQREEDGLIRVKTKLLYREDSIDFRLPILLPGSHPLVEQLIRLEHEEHGHCGVQSLMCTLRERFWIVRGKRVVKRLVKSCMRCRRFSSKGLEVEPASLPKDRASDARVFDVIGVDLAGPLFLRDSSKAWIVLFTCAVYRCVHLELVTSLSTESFLWAMDRFVARRGRPSVVYSDNGTNFVGAVNIFKRLDWERIRAVYEIKRIRWCFIPPASPWWGGWWERLIRMVKDLLKRMLGRSSLSYQGMFTVLCQVEALLNGRPLTCVSEEQSDLITLTPAMFLRELPSDEFPELTEAFKQNPRDKYRHLIRLREELRARFRKEYLSLLVQRGRKRYLRELKVGDVVLVGTDKKKRILWPLATIETLLPGKDGVVRVAKVRTATGLLVRPLQRLYPLEFQSVGDIPSLPENIELSPKGESHDVSRKVTKSGRVVKPPLRYQVGL